MVESVLRSVGLTERFAQLLLVVGHAATVENNAHQATYQCGACGANSGLVNARLFAAALNDPAVRRELGKRGIDLPETTVAVATVHDTGTDTVRQVCDDNPYSHNLGTSDLAGLEANLAEAGRRTAGERAEKLPGVRRRNQALDPIKISREVAHRSTDWSEPTPEWGLAGNRAIIVAPRRLSAGLDLGGRVFLQSYERSLDPDHQILEQLMLAPVVVSQWISAQYQFSTVAANVFGAGDKTTLNVIGNVGALQGAHGDLRVGLPWQSLFDRSPLERPHHAGAHEPTRHLVVLAAPKNAVLEIVRRHPTLHQLITNRWATFVVLDDGAHEITPDLTWRSLVPSSGHMPAMSKVRE